MDPAIQIAELYFIPSGLFLAALGSSRTEPLKTAVSAIGFCVALFWALAVHDIESAEGNFAWTLRATPYCFLVLWGCSTVTHAYRWFEEFACGSEITRLRARIRKLESIE